MTYEELLDITNSKSIVVDEKFQFKGNTKGLYFNKNIALSSNLRTAKERTCILAEELGHHETTVGNILNQQITANRKQESQARLWAYNKLIGLMGIIDSFQAGCTNQYEMAEHLNVTESFLADALACYKSKYGVWTSFDNFIIYFDPYIAVLEISK